MAANGTDPKKPTPLPPLLSRRRAPPGGDEEATQTINLGDFTGDQTLSVSEAHTLLIRVLDRRREDIAQGKKNIPPPPSSDVYVRTRKYMDFASRHKSQAAAESVAEVTQGLQKVGLIGGFERAQLGSLCCDTVEEARTLIPSLESCEIDDDRLQQALDDISKLRDFS